MLFINVQCYVLVSTRLAPVVAYENHTVGFFNNEFNFFSLQND